MTPDLWRKYSEWPLAAAAVIFLVAFSIEVIDNVPDRSATVFDIIIWATWGLFVVDYLANLILAERRLHWFTHNLHAAAILVLPMLRPLRLMRLLSVMQFSHRVGGRRLRGRILTYAIAIAILLVYVGALAALDAEQNEPGASITNIGDALWWAAVTLTGTGYGDFVPITLVGKLVAVGLMLGGLAIVGVIAASFATWMIEQLGNRVAEEAEAAESETQSEVSVLTEQVARLTALIESRMPEPGSVESADRPL
jgi:voltage-gated potassium channel